MTGRYSSNSRAAALVLAGLSAVGAAVGATTAGGPAEDPGRVRLACATAQAAGQRPAGAQEPSRAQADNGDARRGRGFDAEGVPYDYGRNFGRGGRGDQRSPRQHEWEETQAFMQRFAFRRYSALEQMPDGESKEQMKKFWFARYRSLQALQKRDPAAYDQRLTQLRVEDQIFGIVSDWSPKADPDGQQLRETLRSQVSQLVDLDLQERQRRVEWLKKELADQGEQLDRDLKQRDTLVEKRVQRFYDWAGRWAARRRGEAEKRFTPEESEEKQDKKDSNAPSGTPEAKKCQ